MAKRGLSTDQSLPDPKNRKLVTNLRSHKLTNGARVELRANGDLLLDGIVKIKIGPKTMALIQTLGIKTTKLQQRPDGYIIIGRTGIHRLLTEPTREKDEKYWLKKGWDGKGRLVVLHLDDNPLNFNIENLRNGPESLNLMLKKATGYKLKNGKWNASFKVNGGKQTYTTTVSSRSEEQHV